MTRAGLVEAHDRTRCIVIARTGLPLDRIVHPRGTVLDIAAPLAGALLAAGRVRLMPWLASRPQRKGEVAHEPEPQRERSWWLADELDDIEPLTAPQRAPRSVRRADRQRRVQLHLRRKR